MPGSGQWVTIRDVKITQQFFDEIDRQEGLGEGRATAARTLRILVVAAAKAAFADGPSRSRRLRRLVP